MTQASKNCAKCGREIAPRKKWKDCWDEIKYCSQACRKGRVIQNSDEELLLQLLMKRGRTKTICPSEILDSEEKKDKTRMEQVREAARRLVNKKLIVIKQSGREVDPSCFRGPIRLQLK